MLHRYNPRFLELDSRWVDALIEVEGNMKDKYGYCNLMYLIISSKLDNFDFGCRRFQELLQRQGDRVDDSNLTVLMKLCYFNPQLLHYDWAVELVQRLGGKIDNYKYTALISLFIENPEKIDFSSKGFKLLWEKEKDIIVDVLKYLMRKKPNLKERVIVAVPDAIDYYK